MRMKSVLALSALAASTFLGSVAFAAPQPAKQAVVQTKKADKAAQAAQAAQAAPAAQEAAQGATAPQIEKAASKKHHAHHKHKKHHRHHRHHRHHAHHRHHPMYAMYEEIPDNNFLLGASLGYAVQKENFITTYTAPVVDLSGTTLLVPAYASQSSKINNQGVIFGLLTGWQWRYQRWMVGLEGNVDFSSNFERERQFVDQEINSVTLTGTVLYERGNIYSLTTRAGYFVTPFFMPYLRLGAQMSRDEVNYQALIGREISGVNFQVPDFSSRKKDVYGFVGGIGVEFPTYIGDSTIRFEYNFIRTDSVIIEDNTFPIVGNHKFRYPESGVGKVVWVWNFL